MSDAVQPTSLPRAQVPPAAIPGLDGLLTLAVGVVVVAALYFGRDVLIPITLAVLLSFLLAPLVDRLRRVHLPRVACVVMAVAVALGIILALGSVIGSQLASLASDLPRYQTIMEQKVRTVRTMTVGRLNDVVGRIGTQFDRAAAPAPAEHGPGAAPAAPAPVPVQVQEPTPSPLTLMRTILAPVLGPLETMLIVLIVAVFILLQQDDLRDRLIRLFGSNDLHRTTAALDDAGRRLSRYFLAQLGINTVFGLVVAGALFAVGVPSPVLWGIIGALMRFVPYIGTLIAAVLPIALAAAVDPGWSLMIWTVVVFLILEPFTGQVVEPMVYGHSTGLSPVSVVVAAIFWTWLWGPVGLLLSTPLTLCLVVLGRHVQRLEFLDVLLGDRPALTPVESFYQRMLADDADEAHDQAEQLLKERSLSSYYDEVALKGLQLAANDARRGVLNDGQVVRIRDAINELIEDLSDHDDKDPSPREGKADAPATLSLAEKNLPKAPAPTPRLISEIPESWRDERSVLCIAGRGPLDEAASQMLAQLLTKHGLGAQVLPHETLSRANVQDLDPTSVDMICISYLDLAGTPSHLRYMMRRLRQQVPGIPILIGLWPAEDEILHEARLRAVLGANHYTSSLRQAVNACLDEAQGVHTAEVEAPRQAA